MAVDAVCSKPRALGPRSSSSGSVQAEVAAGREMVAMAPYSADLRAARASVLAPRSRHRPAQRRRRDGAPSTART